MASFAVASVTAAALLTSAGSTAAAEAPRLTLEAPDLHTVQLAWTGEPGPTGLFLIDRSVTGSETAPRDWQGIADTKLHAYEDTDIRGPGWYCYRVRAKADDFAWSNEACVVRPVVDGPGPVDPSLPAPAGLIYKMDVPRPPDGADDYGSIRWDPVSVGEPFVYVFEESVPPRAGGAAPYVEIERIPSSVELRQIVATSPWRGPYCFRVHIRAAGREGPPSVPLCLPKVTEHAPFDVLNVRAELSNSFTFITVSWEYQYFQSDLAMERSVALSLSMPRDWKPLATIVGASAGNSRSPYVDRQLSGPGWYCYRMAQAANFVDRVWSDEACVARPVVDFGPGPFPPDAGNSKAARHDNFREELALCGLLLMLVGAASWPLFRGYRRG